MAEDGEATPFCHAKFKTSPRHGCEILLPDNTAGGGWEGFPNTVYDPELNIVHAERH